jgi:pimeloyl-ACP methyl ester carboxylesterase
MNIVEAGSCPAVLTRPKGMEEIATLIPGADFRLIPGSGHMIPVEQPALLAALLDKYLETHLR